MNHFFLKTVQSFNQLFERTYEISSLIEPEIKKGFLSTWTGGWPAYSYRDTIQTTVPSYSLQSDNAPTHPTQYPIPKGTDCQAVGEVSSRPRSLTGRVLWRYWHNNFLTYWSDQSQFKQSIMPAWPSKMKYYILGH